MLEQVRKITVRYILLLSPSLDICTASAGMSADLNLAISCQWSCRWEYFSQCCQIHLPRVTLFVSGWFHNSFLFLMQNMYDYSRYEVSCHILSSHLWLPVIFPSSFLYCWLFFLLFFFFYFFFSFSLSPFSTCSFSIGKCHEPGHVGQRLELRLEEISHSN